MMKNILTQSLNDGIVSLKDESAVKKEVMGVRKIKEWLYPIAAALLASVLANLLILKLEGLL